MQQGPPRQITPEKLLQRLGLKDALIGDMEEQLLAALQENESLRAQLRELTVKEEDPDAGADTEGAGAEPVGDAEPEITPNREARRGAAKAAHRVEA